MNDSTLSRDAIVMERTFNAPAAVVWQMWTQPEHFKRWYAPGGFTVPVAEMDVRVGGRHLFCMERQTPDGSMKFWSAGEYTEVVPNTRLVYTDRPADEHGNPVSPANEMAGAGDYPAATVVTIELEDLGGRTRMVVTHAGLGEGGQGASGGWNMAFDKLAEYLAGSK